MKNMCSCVTIDSSNYNRSEISSRPHLVPQYAMYHSKPPSYGGPLVRDFYQLWHFSMDGVDLKPLLDQLEDNIDDLEEILEPLLRTQLSNVTKMLPLLDKAKVHVLITYTIESLIFCRLFTALCSLTCH